jgi:2',3'-cyclic-nucleotide 2'-phosphodiesterase (5'-nucleotidase family)
MRFISGLEKLIIALLLFILVGACSSSYKVVKYQYHNWSVDQMSDSIKDDTYLGILSSYKNQLDSQLSEVIAIADTSLISYRPESPLSNFISDLLLEYGNEFVQKNYPDCKIDFCLANIGGLRTSLPSGEIKVRNIFELLPFENEAVLLRLTGKQVADLADYIVSRDGEGVAGISFGMKAGKAVNIKVQNKVLDPDTTYWMITNDYIANGGDGMKMLTDSARRIVTGEKIRDIVIRKLREIKKTGHHITSKVDGRIYYVE